MILVVVVVVVMSVLFPLLFLGCECFWCCCFGSLSVLFSDSSNGKGGVFDVVTIFVCVVVFVEVLCIDPSLCTSRMELTQRTVSRNENTDALVYSAFFRLFSITRYPSLPPTPL